MSAQQASAPGDGLLTRDQAKALADRVLSFSAGDQTRVTIRSERDGNTRFADASITTSGGVTDTSLTVTVTVGRRRAWSVLSSRRCAYTVVRCRFTSGQRNLRRVCRRS